MMTELQREVVEHFTTHMPPMKRAMFEAQVSKTLKQTRQQGDPVMQATKVCVDVMWAMWSSAKKEHEAV